MPRIYQLDASQVYQGVSRDIGDADPCPLGWVWVTPPTVPDGKFAYFRGPDWIIIDEYPGSYPPPPPPENMPVNEPPTVS
jgi:hypothetical protein